MHVVLHYLYSQRLIAKLKFKVELLLVLASLPELAEALFKSYCVHLLLGLQSLINEGFHLLFRQALLFGRLLDEIHVVEDDFLHGQCQNLLLI